MIKALEKFKAPKYLLRMIKNYLKDRILEYETTNGTRRREVTAGVAQGSILGPDLCNILYDDILRMETPADTYLSGYADYIVAVIVARDMQKLQ